MSRLGTAYWSERTPKSHRRSYPAFRGDRTAEAVVIGGGLTGCIAAYVLANAGVDVVLLEADRIAQGSTAASLGVISPEPDADFRAVQSTAGKRVARIAWTETRKSAKDYAALLRKLAIRCDLKPAPLLVNARTPEAADRLRREQAARTDGGVPTSFMSAPAARSLLKTDSFGALRSADGFTYDPVRAAIGLATAAAARGARIFERSRVRRTRFTRKSADVVLPTGVIRTQAIFVATGAPGDLFSPLRRHVPQREGFVVTTDRLAAAMRRETGPLGAVVTEPDRVPWTRAVADDRLMFAGAEADETPARSREKLLLPRTADLMYELSVRYPSISGVPAAWGWRLPIADTPDGLPWLGAHRNYPFHFFAMALGWHGDSLAWWAARAMLRRLKGDARRDDEAFSFSRYL